MASFFNLCFPWLKSKESRSADMSTQPDNSHDHPSDTKDIHCMRKSDENSKRILRTANYEPLMVTARAASRRSTHLPVAKGERPEVGHTFSWAEKYQPKALKDFICHREKAESIRSTVCRGHYNHCIFEGPPGVGKRTMALAMLRECAGMDITETKEEIREFDLLIQIDLSEIRWHATEVILDLLQETYINGQAIIVNEAERLSKDAQLRIKSFLQTYRGHCKVIFCCYDISRLHDLSPLCMVIPLLPPSDEQIVEVLHFIAKKQDIELPDQLANNIAEKSKRCLQQAIRSFEATWHSNYPFKEEQLVLTGWEKEIADIATSIIEEQSSKRLFLFRQKLQILLQHNLCPQFVFFTLVEELKRHLDDRIQMQIGVFTQTYNDDQNEDLCIERKKMRNQEELFCGQMRTRVAGFVRIEEFVAKFMSFYKYNGIKQG
uniref:AAA+ ATPase domain-containing protein n=1 Tax=Populus trichocarpa TaxID=3694 RepID=A0A3N7EQB6_POPTR|eukprot:XP_024453031.1 replication factor C subunit 3 isoform X3 [Populus trichocarpa]